MAKFIRISDDEGSCLYINKEVITFVKVEKEKLSARLYFDSGKDGVDCAFNTYEEMEKVLTTLMNRPTL